MAVTLTIDHRSLRPRESVEGSASWDVPWEPRRVTIALAWRTSGKGTVDRGVVIEHAANLRRQGSERFRFDLPRSPYSFSGRLVSLVWQVECRVEGEHTLLRGEKASASVDFVLSPTGQELRVP